MLIHIGFLLTLIASRLAAFRALLGAKPILKVHLRMVCFLYSLYLALLLLLCLQILVDVVWTYPESLSVLIY